jgi:N4-gp56 family major capsid protein
MADAVTVSTETKNDLIIERVQRELKFKAKLFPTVADLSSFAVKGTKSISIPRLSSFTVANRAFGAAADATALTDAKDTINLDNNAYLAWIEDKSDEIQATWNYRLEQSIRGAGAHGRNVDEKIIAAVNAAASLNINGAASANITEDNILDMRKHLLDNEAMLEDCVLVIGTSSEKAMLQIDDFIRADHYGSSNIPDGVIGKVYGVKVMVHTAVAGQQAYMYAKDGIGFAFQKAPSMSEQKANEYGADSVRVAMDQLFGVGGLQLSVNGVGPTESPLVTKLED